MHEKQTTSVGTLLSSLLELSAKGVAVLSAAALSTAFIYDAVRFLRFDERLLGFFVISDHIETAVAVLPWITLFTASMLTPLFSSPMSLFPADLPSKAPRLTKWMRRFILASIVVYIGMLVSSFYFTSWTKYDARWQFLPLILLGPPLGIWIGRSRLRLLAALPFVWVGLTVLYAFGSANDTLRQLTEGPPPLADTVFLNDQGQLFGKVIKIVDKGVIVARANPVAFMFIPKEKVSRVDLATQANK